MWSRVSSVPPPPRPSPATWNTTPIVPDLRTPNFVPLKAPPSRAATALALGTISVVWGSTYLGIRIAVETMPPFLMAGARFLVAGVCSITKLRIQLMNDSGIAGVEKEIMSRYLLVALPETDPVQSEKLV